MHVSKFISLAHNLRPFSVSLLVITLTSMAFAEAEKGVLEVSRQCITQMKLQDSGVQGLAFNDLTPVMNGKCVNEDKFRSIKILKNDSNSVVITNYKHKGEFWRAEIPKGAIKETIFQIVYFDVLPGVKAAHTQLIFNLSKPIFLQSQANNSRRAQASNLMISVEAAFPKGHQYNFVAGVTPYYALVHRFLSVEERVNEGKETMEGLLGYKIFGQFIKETIDNKKLNLSPREADQLMLSLINRGNQLGMNYHYHTMRPNCTTELFDHIDLLKSIKAKDIKAFETEVSNDPIGGPSIRALQKRGLLPVSQ